MTFKLDPKKAALLIIDMQKGFIEQGAAMEVSPGRDIIPNIQKLMSCCRNQGIPVIFTRFVYTNEVPNLIGNFIHNINHPPLAA